MPSKKHFVPTASQRPARRNTRRILREASTAAGAARSWSTASQPAEAVNATATGSASAAISTRAAATCPRSPESQVEDAVILQWRAERLSEPRLSELRDALLEDLRDHTAATEAEATRLDERIHAVRRERFKWAEKAMEGVVPLDIAIQKQSELANQLASLESQRQRLDTTNADHKQLIRSATHLAANCGANYAQADDASRRRYNQAWFEGIYLDIERGTSATTRVERTDAMEAIRSAGVRKTPSTWAADRGPSSGHEIGRSTATYRVQSRVGGSNLPCLVGLTYPHTNRGATAAGPVIVL
jgi:hypothetical protein